MPTWLRASSVKLPGSPGTAIAVLQIIGVQLVFYKTQEPIRNQQPAPTSMIHLHSQLNHEMPICHDSGISTNRWKRYPGPRCMATQDSYTVQYLDFAAKQSRIQEALHKK
ncbi:hypothetical protein ABBQ38_008597 [Trebouxia sp. C0009 RCD-2024]